MIKKVRECLSGEEGSYILPFFWQHGEEEQVLREYMNAIHNANIREVCLEARPHPDYAGEAWFRDVDIILDEAKKLGMKLWILDDAHFPSGQAAGTMADAPAELCKQFLNYHVADICGPVRGTTLDAAGMAHYVPNPFAAASPFGGGETRVFDDDRLFAVVASRLDGKEGDIYHVDDTLLDLTDQVAGGILHWDVPEGSWRIWVIYATRNGGGRGGYVNFMSKASCRKQIEACYEPHYARYKEEFGKTILGFFSDEPEIGNVSGYSGAAGRIGNPEMPLPWSEELPPLMEARFGADYRRKLVALWTNVGSEDFTAAIRTGYMDIVTRLAQKNFGEQLGDWCRAHGVEYIGHIVEDNDNSTKLGSSQGHYFRALWGQDWAGIDDIGGQVTLGGANISHKALLGTGSDGEFYHHVLGKLGTSLADIDPKKQGRCMCEVFGAYGWNEGTRLMKYLADHFLVRGVNRYVPHAFDPKAFPDGDCPPHFYAHGKNPLYKPFGELMAYLGRVCHLISGGKHEVETAILYHAEAEWAGGDYMDMVKPARALDEAQIDYDFLPADVFSAPEDFDSRFDGETLWVNGHGFKALVIPGAAWLPPAVLDFAAKAKESGFPVLFAGRAPEGFEAVALPELAGKLRRDVSLGAAFPELQVYHYSQGSGSVYLISNESAGKTFHGSISLSAPGHTCRYDALQNRLYALDLSSTVTIEPYEMLIVIVTPEAVEAQEEPACAGGGTEIAGPWRVSFTENERYPDFDNEIRLDTPENILKYQPDFSGVIRYENSFRSTAGNHELLLEDAYESAEVWVNGQYAGMRFAPPYRFDLGGLVRDGENELRIEVRTTLERKVHKLTGGMGFLGPEYNVVLPSGIVGKVTLR
ncbi:MAG: hypothetical protein IJ617_00485 [Oscillospiraceae bacterium]|nr:hypothetical protein [Oscillospiraceae bacterium]